jgi:hypothetical protein
MKKIYSLLFVLSLTSPLVQAKTTGVGIPNIYPHMGSGSGSNSSPAASYSRIIGYTYLKYNGSVLAPVDSTTYTYSFGRGGQLSREDMDDNFVRFDDSYTYLYNASTGTYRNQYHRFQAFNGAGKTTKYTCQSWSLVTGAWRDSARYVYNYNTDLTLLLKTSFDIFYGGNWVQHVTFQNYHDNKGNLLKMRSTVFNMTFTYDANDNILTRVDSQVNISPFYWYAKDKFVFSYDATNRVASYTVQRIEAGNWTNKEKYDYTYSGNNISEIAKYAWNNNTWEIQGKNVMSYDANNNIASDEWQYWDVASVSFKSASRRMWTYNNFNQPLTYYSQTFEPSTSSWGFATDDFLYRYYYQSYIPAAIAGVQSPQEMKLYPQPAVNALNVALPASTDQYELSVSDVQGRMLKQAVVRGGDYQLDVADLPNGTYFLRASSSGDEFARRFIVNR